MGLTTGNKPTQINVVNNKTGAHRRRHIYRQKTYAWKTITDTLTQIVLGEDDDYDESSSSSDSESVTQRPQQSRWRALASSAFAGLAPRIWDCLTSKGKKKKPLRKRIKKYLEMTTSMPFKGKKLNEEETEISSSSAGAYRKGLSQGGEGEDQSVAGVDSPVRRKEGQSPQLEQVYKMSARKEDLAVIEQAVADTGRKLSFIEYAAILEIMVLTVIAAGVFRTGALPLTLSVFAKA